MHIGVGVGRQQSQTQQHGDCLALASAGSSRGSACLGYPVIAGLDVALKFARRNVGPRAVLLDFDGTFANSMIELRSAHAKNVAGLRYLKAQRRQCTDGVSSGVSFGSDH
jgi:hypothetical protein